MTTSKKELEEMVLAAVDSIYDQLKYNDTLRPEKIVLYNGEVNDLEYFKTVLSSKFPLGLYSPTIILADAPKDYSIDVSFFLKGLTSVAAS